MRKCISVDISNDNVSERVEYFNFILTSEGSRLTLNCNTTTVSIHDDDSKLTISTHIEYGVALKITEQMKFAH